MPSPEELAEDLETVFLPPATQREFFQGEAFMDWYKKVLEWKVDETRADVRNRLQNLMQRTEAVCLADVLTLLAEQGTDMSEDQQWNILVWLTTRAYNALHEKDQTLPPLETTEWNPDRKRLLRTDDEEVEALMHKALEILMAKYGIDMHS